MDEAPSELDMQYRVISEEEMVTDLKNLATAPARSVVKMRISGFPSPAPQEKDGLSADQWPMGQAAGHHADQPYLSRRPWASIPGPEQIDLSEQRRERVVLHDPWHAKIACPSRMSKSSPFPGRSFCRSSGFDRVWHGDTLKRLPQEDICQSLGYPSAMKYQRLGGPGVAQIMELLRESDTPIEDRETFFRAQIFFFLIGASDGHAKNFQPASGAPGAGSRSRPSMTS